MSQKLTQTQYQELFPGSPLFQSLLDAPHGYEASCSCSSQLGKRSDRRVNLRGIDVLMINSDLEQGLDIEMEPYLGGQDCIEIGFNLLGNCHGRSQGNNFLECELNREVDRESWNYAVPGGRVLKVDLHLPPALLRSFMPEEDLGKFPIILQQILEHPHADYYECDEVGTITPQMKVALEQILHCPFTGIVRQIYLEGACLQLIALKLEQLSQVNLASTRVTRLSQDDIDRLHQARAILQQQFNQPPSLMELARQVGINDCKLKSGFRQIFGTTVFGYLHYYRMIQAKQWLETGQMNISEVARAVGYASRTTFHAAFKRQFGVSPSCYLR